MLERESKEFNVKQKKCLNL